MVLCLSEDRILAMIWRCIWTEDKLAPMQIETDRSINHSLRYHEQDSCPTISVYRLKVRNNVLQDLVYSKAEHAKTFLGHLEMDRASKVIYTHSRELIWFSQDNQTSVQHFLLVFKIRIRHNLPFLA